MIKNFSAALLVVTSVMVTPSFASEAVVVPVSTPVVYVHENCALTDAKNKVVSGLVYSKDAIVNAAVSAKDAVSKAAVSSKNAVANVAYRTKYNADKCAHTVMASAQAHPVVAGSVTALAVATLLYNTSNRFKAKVRSLLGLDTVVYVQVR